MARWEKIEKRDGYSEAILKKTLSLPWFHSFTVEESEKQDFANWKKYTKSTTSRLPICLLSLQKWGHLGLPNPRSRNI